MEERTRYTNGQPCIVYLARYDSEKALKKARQEYELDDALAEWAVLFWELPLEMQYHIVSFLPCIYKFAIYSRISIFDLRMPIWRTSAANKSLLCALKQNHIQCVQYWIKYNPELKNYHIKEACKHRDLKIVDWMLESLPQSYSDAWRSIWRKFGDARYTVWLELICYNDVQLYVKYGGPESASLALTKKALKTDANQIFLWWLDKDPFNKEIIAHIAMGLLDRSNSIPRKSKKNSYCCPKILRICIGLDVGPFDIANMPKKKRLNAGYMDMLEQLIEWSIPMDTSYGRGVDWRALIRNKSLANFAITKYFPHFPIVSDIDNRIDYIRSFASEAVSMYAKRTWPQWFARDYVPQREEDLDLSWFFEIILENE